MAATLQIPNLAVDDQFDLTQVQFFCVVSHTSAYSILPAKICIKLFPFPVAGLLKISSACIKTVLPQFHAPFLIFRRQLLEVPAAAGCL